MLLSLDLTVPWRLTSLGRTERPPSTYSAALVIDRVGERTSVALRFRFARSLLAAFGEGGTETNYED